MYVQYCTLPIVKRIAHSTSVAKVVWQQQLADAVTCSVIGSCYSLVPTATLLLHLLASVRLNLLHSLRTACCLWRHLAPFAAHSNTLAASMLPRTLPALGVHFVSQPTSKSRGRGPTLAWPTLLARPSGMHPASLAARPRSSVPPRPRSPLPFPRTRACARAVANVCVRVRVRELAAAAELCAKQRARSDVRTVRRALRGGGRRNWDPAASLLMTVR